MVHLVAQVACETGISPNELMKCEEEVFMAIVDVLTEKSKAVENASNRSRA